MGFVLDAAERIVGAKALYNEEDQIMGVMWDIAVFNRNKDFTLGVQAKTTLNVPDVWAINYHQDFIYGKEKPPYFLLAFPDRFHFWKEDEESIYPLRIDTGCIFESLFNEIGVKDFNISRGSFEMVVGNWLWNVFFYQKIPVEKSSGINKMIFESGLYESLNKGTIEYGFVN